MSVREATPEELSELTQLIDGWAADALKTNELLLAVDHDPELRRWYVRMSGDDKSFITIWLTLRQRTLHFETYFMPAPEENREACLEYLLRANQRFFAWRFAIGGEDAVYLVGTLPLSDIDEDELDRIVGSGWAYSEQHFRSAMTIGYESRYRPSI
jgi:hypothetical protein